MLAVCGLAAVSNARALDPHRGLSEYGRQAWTTENGLPQNTVRAMAQTMDGFLWLGTEDGLVRFDGAAFRVFQPENTPELASGIIEALTVEGPTLRIVTAGGLTTYTQDRFQQVGIPRSQPQNERQPQKERDPLSARGDVTAQIAAGDGGTWIATVSGIERRSGTGSMRFRLPEVMGVAHILFEDREGALWVGCERGLARIADGRIEVLGGAEGIGGGAVLALFEDREGSLWIGTETYGLIQLHERGVMTYGEAEGLKGGVARAVLEDGRGAVWIGTDGGGLVRATGKGSFAAVAGLSSNVVPALAVATNGDIWAGTPTGLNRIRDGKVRIFAAADGMADDFIRSLLVDRHGAVWAGTRHGLTRMEASGTMTTFTVLDGLGSDFVGAMLESRNGDLWIGTAGGLTRFREGRFTTIAVPEGLSKNVVTAMVESPDGTIWLGSNGGGLSRLRGDVAIPVRAFNLPAAVSSLLEDRQGRVWIGSRQGIVRVIEKDLDAAILSGAGSIPMQTYNETDGMRSRECSAGGHPAAMRAGDGTLWFATLRGVSVVDPEHLRENAIPPPVAIEQVLIDDRPETPGATELTIAPGSHRVEFDYAGLSYVAPAKVRYRYRLMGFDADWIEAGSRRTAFYTNLRPGRYTFQVMAANNDGVWSVRAAKVLLRQRPFFRQTVWFYLLLLLLTAATALLIYAERVRRVEATYRGAMEERSRIAREIHDGLAQGIVGISLQLEVVGRLMESSIEGAHTQLDAAKEMVRESLQQARSAIWELREDRGELPVRLGAAVQRLAGTVGRTEVTGSYRMLGGAVEEELLRIAQEAVTNAVRHGVGTTIMVRLVYALDRLELSVRDNGQGFEPKATPARRFGVRGMRERAAKIGARLEVESAPGEGTLVRLELPLKS